MRNAVIEIHPITNAHNLEHLNRVAQIAMLKNTSIPEMLALPLLKTATFNTWSLGDIQALGKRIFPISQAIELGVMLFHYPY